ncbi:hypothetical protein [Dyadobacter chenhuakuii]|uniref:Uncharacterized protein n=1 Tax=Dyadobacter chenhuakuii TaxID=2909339 RepID=A0A9X1TRM9_9BACT|nr:hypothetical protein [Dyadobacter chenhuakuii]MCF2498129.1 hypothetical protein [Dyadobacter chenhuakuii]
METTNCKAGHHKINDWDPLVSAVISSSCGGAFLGGSLFNMTGALIGGALGIIVEIWSYMRLQNHRTQSESL